MTKALINNTVINISAREADFNVGEEYAALVSDNPRDGAVVTFTGRVREFNQGSQVSSLILEHYPAMTEKALQDIAEQACERWNLSRIIIIHRVGKLDLCDQIVFVGTTSPHREDAFQGAQFLMDYLKTRAPFWKKEATPAGERWVEALEKDKTAEARWGQEE
ncbi:MAG: molybdopterin synthase catalytic subunit MoaE [Cellvibrionaceae bacterium]